MSAALLFGVALAATLAVPSGYGFELRCLQGRIEAVQTGRIWPSDEHALDLRPLPIHPPSSCADRKFDSRDALARAYLDTALESLDAASATQEPHRLDEALWLIETLEREGGVQLPIDAGVLTKRKHTLLLTRVRAELASLRSVLLRAHELLRIARGLGVDQRTLSDLERELERIHEQPQHVDDGATSSAPEQDTHEHLPHDGSEAPTRTTQSSKDASGRAL